MNPIIIEGFMPRDMEDEIERVLMGPQFPWFMYPNTNATDESTQDDDAPQFVHGFIQDERIASKWATVPQAIVQRLKLPNTAIIRAKANILGREKTAQVNPRHIDDTAPHLVMVYYVNSVDGETHLYDGDTIAHRVKPKKGRAVIFDGQIEHASSSPVEHRYRCILNYNLKPDIPLSVFEPFKSDG